MVQERSGRIGRRLSAIMAADVVGYSRLMHHDEESTHTRLTALLAGTVEPAIAEYGGRVVKHTGDGFLAEFPSAVEAVRAARHFQDSIRNLTAAEAEDRRLVFRVGINIGDVIVEAHDIFGDGVNIAARLEGIAEPGGICISASAYDQVRGKVSIEVTDLGEQKLKNIALPVRAYAVVVELGSGRGVAKAQTSPPSLSIVVLPFTNIGGDAEQDYFVDGVTESLTTDLSRIGGSFVISRNTAFTFKNKAVDIKKVGRELNVRYVLEGSVQRGSNRLRVNVQLISAETGNHLWAERFDKPIADLFDMQDEIVSRLANTLDSELVLAEAKRVERVLNPNAIELYFQGMAWIYKGPTHENYFFARALFEKALALDPTCIEALFGVARTVLGSATAFIDETRWERFAEAEPLLERVLELAPNLALAHALLGLLQINTKRVKEGIFQCEQAIALDKNLANGWGIMSYGKQLLGYAEQCESDVVEALRLSPRDIFAFRWLHNVGVAKLLVGDDAGAIGWFRRSLDVNRNYAIAHFHLAAALGLIGELEQARTVARTAVTLDQNFTIRRFRLGTATDNPTYLAGRERIYEGMRIAGLPEG